MYDKYAAMAEAILAAGPDHVWASTDSWTEEQQTDFWTRFKEAWTGDVQNLVTDINADYLDSYGEAIMGMTPDVISANEGLQIAFGMALWGFANKDDAGLTGGTTGTVWDLVTTFPTIEDYYKEAYAKYAGDLAAYGEVEPYDAPVDLLGSVNSGFIGLWGPKDEAMGGTGVPNIAGIKKVDDYTVEVTVNGFSAPAVYSILGISVTPLHHYVASFTKHFGHIINKSLFEICSFRKPERKAKTNFGVIS